VGGIHPAGSPTYGLTPARSRPPIPRSPGPIRRRCRRERYDGSAARRARLSSKAVCRRSVSPARILRACSRSVCQVWRRRQAPATSGEKGPRTSSARRESGPRNAERLERFCNQHEPDTRGLVTCARSHAPFGSSRSSSARRRYRWIPSWRRLVTSSQRAWSAFIRSRVPQGTRGRAVPVPAHCGSGPSPG
jgi:hypothetical protein